MCWTASIAQVSKAQTTTGQSVQSLMLVASTDGDRLVGACLKQHVSNRTLARQRGETVQASLKAKGIAIPAEVLVTGPFELANRNVADDRVVIVYGLITRVVAKK